MLIETFARCHKPRRDKDLLLSKALSYIARTHPIYRACGTANIYLKAVSI
jgi:hypothetical protein